MNEAEHRINYCLPFVEHRRCAIDIGAHVGLYSTVMALHFPQVHAFEPAAENRARFAAHDRVKLYPFAVADFDGAGYLIKPKTSRSFKLVRTGTPLPPQSLQAVPVVHLDGLDLGPVDLIKIDVEGGELEALKGGERLIQAWKPVMIIEEKFDKARGASALLHAWGYTAIGKIKRDWIFQHATGTRHIPSKR